MAKFDTIFIEKAYHTCFAFEKLNPQEIAQLSHLLAKAVQLDERYVGGDEGYQYTRVPAPLKVKIVSSADIKDPEVEQPEEEV